MATATFKDPTLIEFDVRTDEMLVNMGPQHPSTHGVLRLVLRTDGEIISDCTPHLGYLHRCAEKVGENVTPIQFIPYTDRMDYLAAMNMNLGYSLAVEKLCGMKIPEKANVIRVIIAELNRIASHLGGMGKDMALAYACSGPMLRGSLDRSKGDPDWDLRRIEPYCGYEGYDFKVIIPPFPEAPPEAVLGDCWHRFYVRMLEVVEAIKIIEQGIKKYATAQGSHRVELPKHLPAGEAYVETECPRGQMGFYVVGSPAKSLVPLRVRARSSSMANVSLAGKICEGCLIADIPAIIGSIDIVMGEIEIGRAHV